MFEPGEVVVERDWITEAGLQAVCVDTGRNRNGYVKVPRDSPLFEYKGDDLEHLAVHGDVTFAGRHEFITPLTTGWWIGFDCGHAGDGVRGLTDKLGWPVRSLEYVVEQCESLAHQIAGYRRRLGRPSP